MNLHGLSFCESQWASSVSRWHLRELTSAGRFLGGGIDTPSICRIVQVHKGWDLKVPVTEDRVKDSTITCAACAKLASERT